MNKLIKYFNTNYGKEYGKIAYPRTTLQIYRTYQAIKSYGINDEKLVELLHNIKLPKPKTIEEKELYADCLYNKDDSELTTKEYVDEKVNSIPVGTEILETTAQTLKGAINEVNSQFKDITKKTITTEERNKLSSLENYDDTGIKNDIQTQKARIDSLASLKEGSTTGDAELIDGRIDDNGITHVNIGSNIRNIHGILNSFYNKISFNNKIGTEITLVNENATYENNILKVSNIFTGLTGFDSNKKYKFVIQFLQNKPDDTLQYWDVKFMKNGVYNKTIIEGSYKEKNKIECFDVENIPDGSNFSLYINGYSGEINVGIVIFDVTNMSDTVLNKVNFNAIQNDITSINLSFPNDSILGESLKNIKSNKIEYFYKDKVISGLGDSLTAAGSGGFYRDYVKDYFKLSPYVNCGVGGTRISGSASDAMWQDSRINSLSLDSIVVTVAGGTNDAPYTTVQDSDFTLSNHNTDNFVGAYNVLLSKIYYKFKKQATGYYSDIDYSDITQVDNVDDNFSIILITPPKRFDSDVNLQYVDKFAEYVKKIGKMWGISVLDINSNMQMNLCNYPNDRDDKIHFPIEFHKKYAELLIGKLKDIEPIY